MPGTRGDGILVWSAFWKNKMKTQENRSSGLLPGWFHGQRRSLAVCGYSASFRKVKWHRYKQVTQASDHPVCNADSSRRSLEKSREARECKKKNINFKEDFSKEDREACAKLWPKVQEARKNGKIAFLKEGNAFIDGLRVDPWQRFLRKHIVSCLSMWSLTYIRRWKNLIKPFKVKRVFKLKYILFM